ncbi:hypothetical protein MKW98_002920, partial [Papaver atlanticum]
VKGRLCPVLPSKKLHFDSTSDRTKLNQLHMMDTALCPWIYLLVCNLQIYPITWCSSNCTYPPPPPTQEGPTAPSRESDDKGIFATLAGGGMASELAGDYPGPYEHAPPHIGHEPYMGGGHRYPTAGYPLAGGYPGSYGHAPSHAGTYLFFKPHQNDDVALPLLQNQPQQNGEDGESPRKMLPITWSPKEVLMLKSVIHGRKWIQYL